MTETGFHFHRTDYARALADALTGAGLQDYSSGLFLAAPRRTGKSTFLRRDLIPELERKQVVCVYVDLWEDRTRDPADLIAEAIRKAISGVEGPGVIENIARTGITKLSFAGFTVDLSAIGKPDGTTLGEALAYLQSKCATRIALIIDEAQHALVSKEGSAAIFALKAARDAINQNALAGQANLILVFTGSNRDKLSSLVIERKQAFFGAPILKFPLLDRAFSDALTIWVNKKLNPTRQFAPADVAEAFSILGARPELIRQAIGQTAMEAPDGVDLGEALKSFARNLRDRLFGDITLTIEKLKPLTRAVLEQLVEVGAQNFTPFNAASLGAYARKTGKKVTASQVQAAIEALRKAGLLWSPERGVYAVEDTDVEMAVRQMTRKDV